jgi:hypothetical protein
MSGSTTRKGRTSKKSNGSNSQAKLKYINSCVKNMIESLPRQTFSQLVPFCYETPSSFTPIVTQVLSKKPKRSKKKLETPVDPQILVSSTITNESNEISSNHPLFLNYSLTEQIHIHPNIHITCAFCNQALDTVNHVIEQPHARRRFTPICGSCKSCGESSRPTTKGKI